ncbi:MAG: hypothetical protein KDK01_02275 [Rhodobacteraceae bacterium]|nr:hypothetical protein [Paracoccaceae bacterium]
MAALLGLLLLGLVFSLVGQDADTDGDLGPDGEDPDYTPPLPPELGDDAILIDQNGGETDDSDTADADEYRLTGSNHRLNTGGGDDLVVADGADLSVVYLGDGDDTALGGEERNVFWGEAGDDALYGGGGNDSLLDTQGANLLHGGAGDDFLRGGDESTLVGGAGRDTFELHLSTRAGVPLLVADFDPDEDSISAIHAQAVDGDELSLRYVEREDGTGTDIYSGDRHLAAVNGASTADLNEALVVVQTNGGRFSDGDGGNVIRNDFDAVETIFGNGGDDTIYGFHGDVIDGGDGDDLLFGTGRFADDLDQEEAGTMSTLSGGAGDDIILSTNGNVITGGAGADTIGLSLSQYNGAGTGAGFDLTASIITDFNPEEDVIYLEAGFITQEGGSVSNPAATLSIEVWEDGTGANIMAGDQVIARVAGGQSLTVADLRISENGLESDLLGHH